MKKIIIIVVLILAVTVCSCTENKAKELFETAQFEELQNNQEHAVKLYEEILQKYPESEHAKKAIERLSQLKKK